MNLTRYNLHAPTNQSEFDENIDKMLDGEPFWSIAPLELGSVQVYQANKVLRDLPKQGYAYVDNHDLITRAIRRTLNRHAISQISRADPNCQADNYLYGGVFDEPNTADLHIDSGGDGRRKTSRAIVAAYPVGTLAVEGPMQINIDFDELNHMVDKPTALDVVNFDIKPLDGQTPNSITPGAIALLTECTVHSEPPITNERRWFVRQFLRATDMFTED